MTFFTAGDVLEQASIAAPDEPVTIHLDDSIYEALSIMFRRDFSQLPVLLDDHVTGTVTYESIARMLKSVPNTDIRDKSVKGALVSPRFISEDQDLFQLFETFADDEYVLVGTKENLTGILTRYDVFYFLRDQFEPFIQVGDIERSLRILFRDHVPNLEQKIEETFTPRENGDPSYSPPDSIDHFNFEEYKRFIVRNIEHLPGRIAHEREFVLDLLEQVRQNRNALFHFRVNVDEIDRETLDVAHSYFTGIVE